jgi:hypothetical protein
MAEHKFSSDWTEDKLSRLEKMPEGVSGFRPD